ncbi:MAG: histidine triad nucleotide-binding protein [Actinomycetota bacterium]
MSSSCLFCRVVVGETPAEILHETETMLAFRDIRPQAPTHLLLIPKEHLTDLREVRDEHAGVMVDIVQAAVHLARTERIHESGWRLVANVGPDAGQSVFHLHFHLLGGRRMAWPPG